MLNRDKVILDQRKVVVILSSEHPDHTSVIDSRGQRNEKVRQEKGLFG